MSRLYELARSDKHLNVHVGNILGSGARKLANHVITFSNHVAVDDQFYERAERRCFFVLIEQQNDTY